MQIKFKTAYSLNSSPEIAQIALLEQWTEAIKNSQINYIKNAKIEFIEYKLLDYPDQEQLLKEYTVYFASFNSNYTDSEIVEEAFKEFSNHYRLLELVITPEDI